MPKVERKISSLPALREEDAQAPAIAKVPGIVWRWLVEGPDPVEQAEPHGLLEVLLPWPVRCLAVAGAFLTAFWWSDTGIGQELAWGLQYGALVLVAIVASLWWIVMLVDMGLAALWFVKLRPQRDAPARWTWLHIITFLNRQIGHIKAFIIWMLIALAASSRLPQQAAEATAVFLIGPPVINGLARLPWKFLGSAAPTKSNGDLLWRRRLLIYASTLLGMVILTLAAPKQIVRLLPLLGAFAGGLALRVARHWWRERHVAREKSEARAAAGTETKTEADDQLASREQFRQQQVDVARRADPFGPLLVLGGVVALVVFSFWQRRKLDDDLHGAAGPSALPIEGCVRDLHQPESVGVRLFVMADAQTHELAGPLFPGQTDLANAIVRSASRPVALDMLSAVPVWQFASVYRALAQEQKGVPLFWAHLGDLADLSCAGELQRFAGELGAFAAAGPLAGIAMGNHEMSFTGSFHWSPYWDDSCPTGRLGKDDATRSVERLFGDNVRQAGGEIIRLDSSMWSPRGGALIEVTPLGIVKQGARARGIIGAFLDSSDGRAFDWGMPGSIGAISSAQLDAAEGAIARLRAKQGDPYRDDPAYVLFAHVPFDQLASASRDRVAAFVNRLDGRTPEDGGEPRVLALITAHTHVASANRLCVAGRILREVVVGSTTDPPQQAALVEIGPDVKGKLALSVRTLQSVSRPGSTCGAAPAISAGDCRRVAAELLTLPACHAAVGFDPDGAAPRDCQELERPSSSQERLAALRTTRGPRDLVERRRLQERDAKSLLQCICRDGVCSPPLRPLSNDAYVDVLRTALTHEDRARELVCLAWAASATQGHKNTGMSLGEALRCAFDDPTAPAERLSVATLEETTCY